MRIRTLSSSLAFALILAIPAFARSSGNDPAADKVADAPKVEKAAAPAPQPRQDQSKKVYTNDDFGWFNPSTSSAVASQSSQAATNSSQASDDISGAQPTPLDPQKDPEVVCQAGDIARKRSCCRSKPAGRTPAVPRYFGGVTDRPRLEHAH